MEKTVTKTITIFALVSIVTVGLVLAGPGREGHRQRGGPEFGPGFGHERPGRFGMETRGRGGHAEQGTLGMYRGLDLTDEQKESIKKITKESKEKREAATEAVEQARKALWETTANGEEAAIRKAAKNLGEVLGDQAVLRARNMASIKAVLTPEQQQKLQERKAKMKERGERFRERMDAPRPRERFQGYGQQNRQWGPRCGQRGFGPRDRGPNAGAQYGPWGQGRQGRMRHEQRPEWDW
jgi:Spy/CpxP family protein refolding chaperone